MDRSERLRVLVIDDKRHIAEMTSRRLEDVAPEMTAVAETRAEEALATFEEMAVDAIVSDYNMPEMDGLELLEAVRERDPDIPFILYTGHGSEKVASDAIGAGVTDYLQKEGDQSNYDLLANRVENAVERAAAQRELRRTRARFQAFAENAPYGVLTIDPDSTIRYANAEIGRLFGHDYTELVGESLLALIPPRLREAHRHALADYIETGERTLGGRASNSPPCEPTGRRSTSNSRSESTRRGANVCLRPSSAGGTRDHRGRSTTPVEAARTGDAHRASGAPVAGAHQPPKVIGRQRPAGSSPATTGTQPEMVDAERRGARQRRARRAVREN